MSSTCGFRHWVEVWRRYVGSIREVNGVDGRVLWVGTSGDTTRQQLRCLPPRMIRMAEAYEACAQALRTWAEALRDAQEQIREALQQAQQAQEEIDENTPEPRFPTVAADSAVSGVVACGDGFSPSPGPGTGTDEIVRTESVDPIVCSPPMDAEQGLEQARERARAVVDDTAATAARIAREVEAASTGEPEWRVWRPVPAPVPSDPLPQARTQPANS